MSESENGEQGAALQRSRGETIQQRAELGARERRDRRKADAAAWRDATAHIDDANRALRETVRLERKRGRELAARLKPNAIIRCRTPEGDRFVGAFVYVSKKRAGIRVRRFIGNGSACYPSPEFVAFENVLDIVSAREFGGRGRRSGQTATPSLWGAA